MDVNEPAQVDASERNWRAMGALDGFLHAIAFAPQDALGGNFLNTAWESVATAIKTSAYSLKALAAGMLPLMEARGGSIVAWTSTGGSAWPVYDWMGVAKAGLECVSRYLARDLGPKGIRVNTVSAGRSRRWPAKDPRVRPDRRDVGATRAARLGHSAIPRRRPCDGVPVVGPGGGDHGRDRPRGRRLPRHGNRRPAVGSLRHRYRRRSPSSAASRRCARAITRTPP